MASPELIKQWRVTVTLLQRAHRAIPNPQQDVSTRVVEHEKEFDNFIAHNELELALDMLEEIADMVPCGGGFWRDLERAAETMDLSQRAQRLHNQFLSTKPQTGNHHQ